MPNEPFTSHDHIVLLIPTSYLDSPPSWLSDNFTIMQGGVHTGGSSQNTLIVFRDGTYIELFAWIAPPKEFLDWANRKDGLIDFALTTLTLSPQECYEGVKQRLESQKGKEGSALLDNINYQGPKPGGRKRKDGIEVKWETDRNKLANPDADLIVPFFCHDVTKRSVRVPFDDETIAKHKCGAIGLASVEVLIPKGKLEEFAKLYSCILGTEVRTQSGNGVIFEMTRPVDIGGEAPTVHLREPTSEEDMQWLEARGVGIRSIKILVEGRSGSGESKLGDKGIASTVCLKW